jgi:ubiquinone/menaquinone biosynthesis C-methylase UbiE
VDHFKQIYTNQAAAYHELIAAEDVDGNLPKVLKNLAPWVGRVLDLGSGSGRISLLLNGMGCEIVAMDMHHAMLVEQQAQMKISDGSWQLAQADGRALPLQAGWADVVTAGWAFGHFTGWYPDDWRAQASRAIAEMRRATKPDGTLIIMETMGTGSEQAAPPSQALADYYAWLEREQGFVRTVIATDYDFGSVERAAELCGFFFGAEMAEKVRARGWRRVPEWTGVFSRSSW